MTHKKKLPETRGELIKSGYQPQGIRTEIRKNLIQALQKKEVLFPGILGYDDTVIPDLTRALLAGHHINLLGLRGQAKTRIARQLIHFLDEYIPVISGSALNEDPLNPISDWGKNMVQKNGDKTPVSWLHRAERFSEKLATPDVSVADLIGDVDPIKAANLKLSLGDLEAIHFGLIPRSNRFIFVLNEIPDLQARIQVALFNLLQESDFQVRGFHFRLPIDTLFVFTANPEDYTQRGSMVTPLKDRIGSQILTHYPKNIHIGKQITRQEIQVPPETVSKINVPELLFDLVEQVAIEARKSEFVDAKSGVSARLTIAAMEHIYAAAETRLWADNATETTARMGDLFAILPAVHGKIELVYEGEQEGAQVVARNLIGLAIRKMFSMYFGSPGKKEQHPLNQVINWFSEHEPLQILTHDSDSNYQAKLNAIPALNEALKTIIPDISGKSEEFVWKEFILHGLAEHSKISRKEMNNRVLFGDLLGGILGNVSENEGI